MKRDLFIAVALVIVISLYNGCANVPIQGIPAESVPDYNKPESEYIAPDFKTISTDFSDI